MELEPGMQVEMEGIVEVKAIPLKELCDNEEALDKFPVDAKLPVVIIHVEHLMKG